MKIKGIIKDVEYEKKKVEFLSGTSPARDAATAIAPPSLGHGVSLVVGAAILLIITTALLSDQHLSTDDLQKALGAIFLFGLWLVPHSIWLMTRRNVNLVLPIIALAAVGLSALAYAGSL